MSVQHLTIAILALGLATAGQPAAVADAADRPGEIPSLEDSIAPLSRHFNQNQGKPRFVTLLSPT